MKMDNKKYLTKYLEHSGMFANIAVHYILRGGRTRSLLLGIFCTLFIIYGFVPPCGALMRPLPLRCSATGKAEPFFYSRQLRTNQSVMHYTEKTCSNGITTPHKTRTPTKRELTSMQKQLSDFQKKLTNLQQAYEQARKEKFYYLFYISKMCSWYLPYYQQKNSIDSQDWEKLYKQSVEQSNIL